MELLHPQLTAFATVLEEASFDAAARRLSVTPSAISQRIKALEDRLGQVLIIRQTPCRPTPAGKKLLRRVKPMLVLETEALQDFTDASTTDFPQQRITLAVNDDSLATWVIAALAELHEQSGFLFEIIVDDQDYSLALLRNGKAIGAITAESSAIQGCNVHALGTMRYMAVASPRFAARYFSHGVDATSLATAPMLAFNRKDELQTRFIRTVTGRKLTPPTHYLPTSIGFMDATARGMGWCMAPDSLVNPALKQGNVQLIKPEVWLDVPLYWQHAAVRSSTLACITRALMAASKTMLHDMPREER